MPKVLVLDDEAAIRGFIRVNLKRSLFEVIEAASGEEALALATQAGDIDIALLDVMLPGIDGIEVCRTLRQLFPRLGIIMLTARGIVDDRVSGLNAGADDYVVKPFSPAELVARVTSLLRRLRGPDNAEPESAAPRPVPGSPFTVSFAKRELRRDDRLIPLTPTEFSLLQLFLSSGGVALSRDQILDRIWGPTYVGDPKLVDVNIRRLRQKVEDDPANPRYVVSVRGFGYRWNGEAHQ